jgi:DNA-binding PadR family transcriptional regulator
MRAHHGPQHDPWNGPCRSDQFGRADQFGRPEFRRRRGDFPDGPSQEFEPGDRGAARGPAAAYPFGPGPRGPRGGHGGPHGYGGPFGEGRGRGPGRRAGRGDVRAAILLLLAEQPRHGYQLIQEITARSDGRWQPSPGAIYPALNLLEDEGLVTTSTESGRRLATLTDAGREYVEQHADELGTPWQDAAERPVHPARALSEAVGSLAAAARQVARSGSDEQAQRAVAVLERARRDLYLLLAGEDPTTTDTAPTE